MLSWQVGAVKITCVVEMVFPLPHDPQGVFFRDATPEALKASPWLYPHFANEDGSLNMSIHALLVEAPGLKLMVDTCVGNDKPRSVTGGNPLTTSFLQHLMDAGWSRDSVDAVICTHLHVDHVGWNTMLVEGKWIPTFPSSAWAAACRFPTLPANPCAIPIHTSSRAFTRAATARSTNRRESSSSSLFPRSQSSWTLTLGKHLQDQPLASPLFAQLSGMPPIRIHVGDDEVLSARSSVRDCMLHQPSHNQHTIGKDSTNALRSDERCTQGYRP